MKIFIGVGVQGMRPEGYTTVDIDAQNRPDIVADAADLSVIPSSSVEVLHASHVLEHFSWPRALLVLNEWARVLSIGGQIRIAVPDMAIYAHYLLNGDNPFVMMNGIYGAHWIKEGGPQGHHFGYTRRMLTQVLAILGFGDFSGWRSDLPEASNTWRAAEDGERVVISLNVAAVKQGPPLLDIPALYEEIRYHNITQSFMVLVREKLLAAGKFVAIEDIDSVLFQKLNYQYMEAAHLRDHYRKELEELRSKLEVK